MQQALDAMERWTRAKAAMGWPDRAEQDYGFALAAHDMSMRGDAYLQAGCGVGKTGAVLWAGALLPAPVLPPGFFDPAEPDGRVILSSFTKAQSAQNLATARRAVDAGLFPRAVELRGRAEYVCMRRWAEAWMGPLNLPAGSAGLRAEVEAAFGPLTHGEWASVNSNSEERCSEPRCGNEDYANRARIAACEGGIVVCTNHSVVAFDVLSEGALFGLGESDVLLLDEGHQVADAFRSALSSTITVKRFRDLLNDLSDASMKQTIYTDGGAKALTAFFRLHDTGERSGTEEVHPAGGDRLMEAVTWCSEYIAVVNGAGLDEPDEKALCSKAGTLANDLIRVLNAPISKADVCWVEWTTPTGARKLMASPIDVTEFSRAVIDMPVATLVMSATLKGQPLTDLGVDQRRLIDAGSPFDLAGKRAGLVAGYPAKGNEDRRLMDLIVVVKDVVAKGGGAIVVSKTSKRKIGSRWVSQIEEVEAALSRAGLRVGVQEDTADVPRLVDDLVAGLIDVAVGKRAMGEGIDVPGPRLSAVIFLDKPYPYMADPVLRARMKRSSNKWAVPNAMMRTNLEQGIGRLIRTVDDEGIVVMLDGSAASEFARAMHPSPVRKLGA